MTKDKLLTEAAYQEDIAGGAEERVYGVIRRVSDFEEYMELRNRPDKWSEKKGKAILQLGPDPGYNKYGHTSNGKLVICVTHSRRAPLHRKEVGVAVQECRMCALAGYAKRKKRM